MENKKKYEQIIRKLRQIRSRESLYYLNSAVLLVLSIVMLTILSVSFIEAINFGDSQFRLLLASLIFLAFLVPGFIFIYPAVLRWFGIKNHQDETIIARRVGEHYEEISDRLSNSIELMRELDTTISSKELSEASFDIIADEAMDKDFSVIIDRKKPRRRLYAFLIVLLVTTLSMSIFNQSIGAAFVRIVNFNKSYIPPAPFSLRIEQSAKSVIKGTKVRVKVIADGVAPLEVSLKIREANQENFDTYNLSLDSGNTYYYEIPSARNTIYFYASSDWMNSAVESKLCTLKVVDKPIVKQFVGRLNYPGYTGLPGRAFDEQTADVTAVRGSSISLNIASNKDLKNAKIVFLKDNGSEGDSAKPAAKVDSLIYNMKVNGKNASGGFSLSQNGQYYITLESIDGIQNENPIKHNVFVTEDEYPSIAMIEPLGDAQVGEDGLLTTQVAIADDYGFSNLKLYYKLIESKYVEPDQKYSSINVPIAGRDLNAQVLFVWDLKKIGISPEDKFEYYFEVYDNDRVSGPKSARTMTNTVRLPSLEEVLRETEQAQDNIEKDLQKVLKQMESIKKESEELNRDLLKDAGKKQEMNWEQKKKASDIAKRQQELQKKVEEVSQNLQNVTEKLKDNNLISPETLNKYMELQKLMREVKSQEFQKMQDQLRKAMDNLTPQQMQEAMKNFKLDEDKLKKSIERTMKMLKRIQSEQKMDALNRKAQDMINKLDELNSQMKKTNPNDEAKKKELAQKQERLKDDLASMNKDIADLEKNLKEMQNPNTQQMMENAKQDLNSQQTQQEMNESQENMKQGNFNKASKNQMNARNNLQKFQSAMKNMKQSMENQLTKEAIRKMQKATKDMAQLSKKQESIKNRTQNIDPNSMRYKDLATEQIENMAAMNNVVSQMMDLAQKTFAVTPQMAENLSNAMHGMQKSVNHLTERQMNEAGNAQQKAMSEMNQAMSKMQSMVSQMQKSGQCNNPGQGQGQGSGSGMGMSGSGNPNDMLKQLQQLAAQQQAINQAMQQMGQGQGSGNMSPEQQALAKRLSKEQGNAKQSLEELKEKQKQFQGGDRKKSELERIAQEMQEVMNEIKSGKVSPETYKKQDRILSRLLDASRSVNEKDYDKKREATTGQDFLRKSPNDFDMSTQQGKSNNIKEFMRSIQNGYTKDYEIIIKQYFEQIQR